MITFMDEPDEQEQKEQEGGGEEVDTGLLSSASSSTATTTNPPKENTDTLSPMYEPPIKREHFIFAHPTQPRSIYSMPHPEEEDSGLDPLTPENHEARWRRQNRITSYKEITWPTTSTSSANVVDTQAKAEALHLEKQRSDMRRLNARYYMRQTGREEHEQY